MTPPTIRKQLTLERTFPTTVEDAWELWTTKDGIESWWGPDGFSVTVQTLELRPGGALVYAMTAVAPEQVAFMKRASMPLTNITRLTFTEVTPLKRLAYRTLADFIPGVAPYDVDTIVEFHPEGDAVRLHLTFDAMHDEHWTKMAVMGRTNELERLARLLAKRNA